MKKINENMLESMINSGLSSGCTIEGNLSGKRVKTNVVFLLLLIVVLTINGNLFAANNCLDFDGTNDYVNIGAGPSIVKTVEFWVNSETTTEFLIDLNGTDYIYINSGTITAPGFTAIYVNGVQSTSISANIWQHIAVTTTTGINASNFNIGKKDSDYLTGKIDEVRIWEDVRTETEIRVNMYKELAGTEAGLIAYYKFNENTGVIVDNAEGTSAFDGTLNNMDNDDWQTSPAFSGPKNCLSFDGIDDWVEIPENSNFDFSQFSISIWVMAEDNITAIILEKETWNSGWSIRQDKWNGWKVALTDDSGTYNISWGDGVPISGQWYYVSLIFDGSTLMLGVDGKLKNSVSISENIKLNNEPISIGSDNGGQKFFKGRVDEICIYNVSLTESQMRKNMYKTLVGNESGLVAYYNFDNTSGSILQDFNGDNNNGTLRNMDDADWVRSFAFNTWLNTDDATWTEATNWSSGSAPVSSDNVGIYSYSGGTDVSLSGLPTVSNLLLGGSSFMTLSSGVTINGNLILESDLDLNGQTITLGSSANLIESGGHLTGTSGTIQTTRNLSNIDEDIAGLGAKITEDGNLGSTTIIRGHEAQGVHGIKRYYQINTSNSPSNATLVFNYLDTELNGQTESTLKLFKSSDGSSWTEQASSINTTDNTMTLSSIDAFSYWTGAPVGSDTALPIELVSFIAENHNGGILLQWSTGSETENQGFILEKMIIEKGQLRIRNWENVADYLSNPALEGQGTTTESHRYSYIDGQVLPGCTYQYRLGDVDYNSKITWHDKVEVKVEAEEKNIPSEFGLEKAYPNPFNPSVTLSYGLTEDAQTTLLIYDMSGQLIQTLQNAFQSAGTYHITWQPVNLSSGVYIVHLRSGNNTNLQKVVFVK